MKHLAPLALILASFCVAPSSAHDPLYGRPSWGQPASQRRRTRRSGWTSSGGNHRTAIPISMYRQAPSRRDYGGKWMDLDEFKTDAKARLWNVNFKTRRPGKYNLSSKLIIVNLICFALQTFIPRVTQMGVKMSDKILRGEELYRLVTPVFLHGNIPHLAMNMFSLNNIGPSVEKLFGPGRYLSTYLAAGVAGNVVSAYQSPNPGLGASGAVFGIIGAQLVFLARNDWLLGRQGESMQSAILQTVVLNLVVGGMSPMIDNWAHLGGLVGGGAAAYYFGPRLYLLELPEGGRFLVDKPVVRFPREIESIPEKVAKRFRRMTRRMQVNERVHDMTDKPWRKPSQPPRHSVPNRSIKPKQFWRK
ncbi:RHOMBOID-like protein 10, chloroplastic [Seminavis robusta]|uniref:RHOMBOID-like protein 10, chloroplastic n=1 Tax=Seminavis robusta TaxID=568900 RepID=A0A9N8EAN4_9STRA|nr:RHOMBOID-like protein 10, chloroplastic [Seminavis robusta]|eukprot:Sro814_g206350.1 RHOMBOID-like protein 10, chloroplastic (361) ;mRNA; r:27245-28751